MVMGARRRLERKEGMEEGTGAGETTSCGRRAGLGFRCICFDVS